MSNPIVSFGEQAVKDELRELVGKTIEETINAMLDEEADWLVGAGPYGTASPPRRARSRSRYAQAQGRVLCHGGRRALQKARDQRGGGHHRDSPGRGGDRRERRRLSRGDWVS